MKKWAETHRGSGRFTGRLADEPVYMDNGDIAPGWVYVGDRSEEQFWAEFDEDIHGASHTPNRPDWACEHCQEAGWVN